VNADYIARCCELFYLFEDLEQVVADLLVVHQLDELEDVVADLSQVDVRLVLVQTLHPVLQLLARRFESAADEGEEPVDVVLEVGVEIGDNLLELVDLLKSGLDETRDLSDQELLRALPKESVQDVQVVVVRDQPSPHLWSL